MMRMGTLVVPSPEDVIFFVNLKKDIVYECHVVLHVVTLNSYPSYSPLFWISLPGRFFLMFSPALPMRHRRPHFHGLWSNERHNVFLGLVIIHRLKHSNAH